MHTDYSASNDFSVIGSCECRERERQQKHVYSQNVCTHGLLEGAQSYMVKSQWKNTESE